MLSLVLVVGILFVFSVIIAVRAKRREESTLFSLDPEMRRKADQAYLMRYKTYAEQEDKL